MKVKIRDLENRKWQNKRKRMWDMPNARENKIKICTVRKKMGVFCFQDRLFTISVSLCLLFKQTNWKWKWKIFSSLLKKETPTLRMLQVLLLVGDFHEGAPQTYNSPWACSSGWAVVCMINQIVPINIGFK